MKNVLPITAAFAAIALAIAGTASAQSSSSSCTGCTPTTPTTQTAPTIQTFNVNVDGYAGSGADFQSMFTGENGEAGAQNEGGAYGVFDIFYDSCDGGDCGPKKVTANTGAFEVGTSWATGMSTKSDVLAAARNSNTAVIGGGLNIGSMPSGNSD